MNRNYQRRGAIVVAVMALATVNIASPSALDARPTGSSRPQTVDPNDLDATKLSPTSRISAAKSKTGRLAQTDPALVGRTDPTRVNVVVKLDYDASASYTGGVEGFGATSPSVTGVALTGKTPAEVEYETYTDTIDRKFRKDLAAALPAAAAGQSLKTVYGGVALTVPANQIGALLALPGVAAVQADELRQLTTDSSNDFIGSPTIWNAVGGQSLAGSGVIFGDLDTGVWPEHPSFADNPALGSPPATATPRECNFGDNPLTVATDVFVCNSKLIGGQPFLDTYNAVVPGEIYPDSARDSNGHGTHTTTTAAGGIVASAPVFGTERGPISGVAPGAWVIAYKVCGAAGCFGSDSAAAVEQAILDGVDVINFSISGGVNPYTDVVELAFLDAYQAGILVAASAGNDGPGAATVNHVSPWVLTVAASTQTREFQSTLTVTSGIDSATFVGSSLTAAVGEFPIILAQNIPDYDARCSTALDPGVAVGKIVACQRGVIGRVQKGYNVAQGGAEGMILYNLPLQDTETDNHHLPTVHLADGTAFLAFLTAHPAGSTGSFTAGVEADGQGDVMAAFSSRGPGGQFLKPDITAPGVQILAGHTPIPEDVAGGPSDEYFQAIAGTSMSSPHAAGAAILLKDLHPDWSPGAIKSALMTTAITDVVKEDLVTPADPFDFGAGRVDLTEAGDARIVFDESSTDMYELGSDPIAALDLNVPSINIPTMPGTVTVTRTATNISNQTFEFDVLIDQPAGTSISVTPSSGRIRPGKSLSFEITITSNLPDGQYFGEITLRGQNTAHIHLPVAFYATQGDVSLSQACDPSSVRVGLSTTCTVTATNRSFGDATVKIDSQVSSGLTITGAVGATVRRAGTAASATRAVLAGEQDSIPSIAPSTTTPGGGYLPLEDFLIAPEPIGDEEILNFGIDPFVVGGNTYTTIGVVSNGYVVLGGGDGFDVDYLPQTLPDVARPNNVLAPYWTDLDGAGAEGIRAAVLSASATESWLIVQWNVQLWGSVEPADARSMQVWIGLNGVEDVSFEYGDDTAGVGTPPGYGLTVGAENGSGTAGAQIVGPPTGSYVVSSTPGLPGESVSYALTIRGNWRGWESLTSTMVSDIVAGTTRVSTPIQVKRQ